MLLYAKYYHSKKKEKKVNESIILSDFEMI